MTVMIVKLVEDLMVPVRASRSTSHNRNTSRIRKTRRVRSGGGLSNTVREGRSSPVDPSNLPGRACVSHWEPHNRPGHSLWQSMSWTSDEPKKLRAAQDKVEDLRKEEQKQGFTEVTLDRDDGKSHAREIAECIARKGSCGVPDKDDSATERHSSNGLTSCGREIQRRRR